MSDDGEKSAAWAWRAFVRPARAIGAYALSWKRAALAVRNTIATDIRMVQSAPSNVLKGAQALRAIEQLPRLNQMQRQNLLIRARAFHYVTIAMLCLLGYAISCRDFKYLLVYGLIILVSISIGLTLEVMARR